MLTNVQSIYNYQYIKDLFEHANWQKDLNNIQYSLILEDNPNYKEYLELYTKKESTTKFFNKHFNGSEIEQIFLGDEILTSEKLNYLLNNKLSLVSNICLENQLSLSRYVTIKGNEKILMLAKAIFPYQTCDEEFIEIIKNLGSEPLGKYIFNQDTRRSEFEFDLDNLLRRSIIICNENIFILEEAWYINYT